MANISADDLEDIKERFDMYDKKGDGKVRNLILSQISVLRDLGFMGFFSAIYPLDTSVVQSLNLNKNKNFE